MMAHLDRANQGVVEIDSQVRIRIDWAMVAMVGGGEKNEIICIHIYYIIGL